MKFCVKSFFDSVLDLDEVSFVRMNGVDGSFQIFKDHCDAVIVLKSGVVEYKLENGHEDSLLVDCGGVVSVFGGNITVLI